MVLEVEFYKSIGWNVSSAPGSGSVGGVISSPLTSVGSTLSDVFPEGVSDYIGQDARLRFQKVFIKNTGAATIANPKIFLNNVKHPGQIQIATGTLSDTGTNPIDYPVSEANFFEPIGLVNATSIGPGAGLTGLEQNDTFGLWIKQSIPSNLPSEVGASTTIGIIGEV